MVSGAIYFLEGLIGRKRADNGSKKGSSREKQKKPEVVPTKKGEPQKFKKVAPLKNLGSSERKKTLEELNTNFRKSYNASSKLKKLAKDGGTDIERFQMQAIHSQMRLVAKMLDNLKK